MTGVPTAVTIRYTFRFRIPEKATVAQTPPVCLGATCPVDPRKPARLTMTVLERGKGKRMPKVEVYVLDQDKVYLTDDEGRLTIELPAGAWAITRGALVTTVSRARSRKTSGAAVLVSMRAW